MQVAAGDTEQIHDWAQVFAHVAPAPAAFTHVTPQDTPHVAHVGYAALVGQAAMHDAAAHVAISAHVALTTQVAHVAQVAQVWSAAV
jgi:hypothetical protein